MKSGQSEPLEIFLDHDGLIHDLQTPYNCEKKSNGATMRHSITSVDENINEAKEGLVNTNNQVIVPDLSTVPEQPYNEDIIDPATIKRANQVDR